MRPFGDYATRGEPVSKKSSPLSHRTSNCSGRRAACVSAADTAASTISSALSALIRGSSAFSQCNEPPNPTEYISERPEMTSHWWRSPAKCQNKKKKR